MTEEKRFTFTKAERLSLKRHVDFLFNEGKSFVSYPLRVVFCTADVPAPPVTVFISVPKKKLKRAVKRNRVKRQVREMYRLRKDKFAAVSSLFGKNYFIAFLYIDDKLHPTSEIAKSMDKIVHILEKKAC